MQPTRWADCKTALFSISLIATLGLAFAPGCAFVANTTAIQCTSEAECLALGPEFAGTTCDKATKSCRKVADTTGTCTKNQECLDRAGGAPAICRSSDRKCVMLTTPECPTVLTKKGNVELANENVIVIGAMTPELHTELGTVMQRMVDLAQFEISKNFLQGLPPAPGSSQSRPLAIVSCREFGSGVEGLLRGADHLVNTVQVPIVIGPVDPQNGGLVWSQVTNPKKVLVIAPTAITSGIVNIPNPIAPIPLIWRLNFDDRAVAAVVSQFVTEQLEPRLIAAGQTPPFRVGAVFGGDALGVSTHAQTMKTLKFNGKSAADNQVDGNFLAVNAGDLVDTLNNPNPEGKIGAALGAMFQFKPHVVLHEYAPALISKVLFGVEGGWRAATPPGTPFPFHIGHQSFFNGFGPLFPFLTGGNADKRNGRFFAVQNYTSVDAAPFPPASEQVNSLVSRFEDHVPEFIGSVSTRAQLAWLLYDATYLAAYSIVALQDKPVTGENLAGTLSKFISGTPVNTFDTSHMDIAFRELAAGRSIDLQGLYGAMNFDTALAAPTYGLEITCPTTAGPTTTGMKGSTFRYRPDLQKAFVTDPVTKSDLSARSPLTGCPPSQ